MFKLILVCALIGFVAAGDERSAEVKSYSSDVRADGFDYALDTSNNIHAVSSGDASGNVHGDFGWISPEGEHVDIKYVANENGYQPQGAWVPTPPPIPAYVLKAIAYIEAHPSKDNY